MKLHQLTASLKNQKAESDKLNIQGTVESVRNSLFAEQLLFIDDRCRKKSVLCPRRAGKTYSFGAYLVLTALKRPRARAMYLCLTRGQAKENIWDQLKDLNHSFELGCSFHETDLRMTFPNGSVVKLGGAETDREIEKYRGQKYDLVIIDESKSFIHDNMNYLIWEVIDYTLGDRAGTLVVGGTPGNVLRGPFFDATCDPGQEDPNADAYNRPYDLWKAGTWEERKNWTWSFHRWDTSANTSPEGKSAWENMIANKEARGIPDNDPKWTREGRGKWAASDSLMVYRLSAHHIWVPEFDGPFGLPEGHDWKYLLGMDIGFHDATALSVIAYADTHPTAYHVWDHKQYHSTVDDIEDSVRKAQEMFGEFEAMIADTGGLGKTVVETLNSHGLGFEAAQKKEKYDHIELLNTDLASGRFKVLSGSLLSDEMAMLQWEDSSFKKEDKSTPNHTCDATLYVWRHAYHYFWEPAKLDTPKFSQEWYEEWDNEQAEAVVARRRDNKELDYVSPDLIIDDAEWWT